MDVAHLIDSFSRAGGDQPHNNLQPFLTFYSREKSWARERDP
jgi:microcystin-dependent protein